MNKIFNLLLKILHFFNFKKKYHDNGIMISYTHDVKKEDLSNFESLIKAILLTHNFITPIEFFDYFEQKRRIPRRSILMTFDDGFLSSYNAAKILLNKYNIKAIFFIPTRIFDLNTKTDMQSFTNNNIYFNQSFKTNEDEYVFMNKYHINELIKDGHYIAPHTHNHVILKNLSGIDSINNELIVPKCILNNIFPQNRSVLAFPVGTEKQVNKFSYDQIQLNYQYCFTTLNGINNFDTNKLCLHRFNLPPTSTFNYLNSVLQGSLNSYYGIKMNLLKKKCGIR
jgi:peptidoglycan/xylan/chitin deacetylase (PgdA/CDA1 family)